MRNVSEKSCRGNKKKTFYFQYFFSFSKIVPFMTQNEKKNCRVGLATDDDMAHAHFMLDTQGYKHAPRIRNTFCLPHSNNGYTNLP